MKTLLALVTAGAALLGAASVANAQDCVNGYRMIKDQIPILCQAGPASQTGFGSMAESTGAVAQPREPLTTGSIGTTSHAVSASRAPEESQNYMADSRANCRPGEKFYMQQLEDYDMPMRC